MEFFLPGAATPGSCRLIRTGLVVRAGKEVNAVSLGCRQGHNLVGQQLRAKDESAGERGKPRIRSLAAIASL